MRSSSRPIRAVLAVGVAVLAVGVAVLAVGVAVLAVGVAVLATALAPSAAAVGDAPQPVGGARMAEHGLIVAAGVPEPPTTTAKTFVVADVDSGDIIAARDPHRRRRPASTLKLLTTLVAMPRLDSRARYRATYADATVEGSRVGVVPGESYSVDELFRGMLVVSGNDAANMIARAAGGSGGIPHTLRMMNAEARRLQAFDTHAVTPNGLDEPGQWCSAYDLALFGRAALKLHRIERYSTLTRARFPEHDPKTKRTSYAIFTNNHLQWNYDDAIGLKTGWTTQARATYVGVARRGGRTMVVSIMGAAYSGWRDTAALLDWGFRNAATAAPVGVLVDPGPVAASSGASTASGHPGGAQALSADDRSPPGHLPWPVQGLVVLIGAPAALRLRLRVQRLLATLASR